MANRAYTTSEYTFEAYQNGKGVTLVYDEQTGSIRREQSEQELDRNIKPNQEPHSVSNQEHVVPALNDMSPRELKVLFDNLMERLGLVP